MCGRQKLPRLSNVLSACTQEHGRLHLPARSIERRFGLVHVDFETQQRTLKRSALAYADFLRERAAG